MGKVTALVGAQYGSEGKGTIAYHLADRYHVHVRTGAPNAGHTIRHNGIDFKMRSIPCGWVNEHATLIIGPGAFIDLDLLVEEVTSLENAGYSIRPRLYVDRKACVIDKLRHHEFEGGTRGYAHQKIGSTGEGVGPARMAKLARGTLPEPAPAWSKIYQVGDYEEELAADGITVDDTSILVNTKINRLQNVLLEGTQGCGLSLVHGEWPYVTSADANAGSLCVDAGISPGMLTDVILVARTYPIRVAGNSGPLRGETSWESIGQPEERTTVTDKVRRVGRWDPLLVNRAIMLNRPCDVALTFFDYLHPDVRGRAQMVWESKAFDSLRKFEAEIDAPIKYIGVGPSSQKFEVVEC